MCTALDSGTATAGSTNSITLAAGASSSDEFYQYARIQTVAGTGSGQSRLCTAYVGSTKVATVAPAWVVDPDGTTDYEIYAADANTLALARTSH